MDNLNNNVVTTHEMRLQQRPFNMIKSGRKTVEMRLNDEKRRKIKKGDLIAFKSVDSGEELCVMVADTIVYSDFEALYRHHDKLSIGYLDDEVANPEDMLIYYSKNDVSRYGVLAIVVSLLK